ncbi:MAG: HupE/UreJ family protein [Acidimicrobiia bacterium]|nr:HupE/UreJ family protein [Acidimicrobiia bacterium]
MGDNSGKLLRPMWRLIALVTIAASMTLANSGPAAAHATLQPYLYVFVTESEVGGRVELAIDDIATVLGLDLDGDDATLEATLREQGDVIRAYVRDHLAIAAEGREWDLSLGRIDLLRLSPDAPAFAVVQYRAAVPADGVPQFLDITFDPFFDEIEGRDGLLLLIGGWEDGAYNPDREVLISYTAFDRTRTVDLGQSTEWGNFRSGVTLGIDHIKTGPDHILFILALLLPSVLVFREAWSPTHGFAAALWRVVKIATFFTIAHSITFTLAGMGWLPLPPSKLVEAIIAASIAAAALHNLRPVFPNREWALAFVFGLFHGMGFATLVAALDVSRTSQLVSLLGRNVGIEIGQVVVILLLFPALYLLRRTDVYAPFLTASSVALAVVALGWMAERLLEVDLGTNGLVDRFASTPNGYWVAAVFTVVAAVIYADAARRNALAPTSQ